MPRAEETDADIIARSRGDPEAFAAVFDRHYDAVHRFLWGRVGQAAEDLTAEVFRIAFEQRDRYDPDYPSAKPWLFGIASRLAKRRHRERVRTDEVRTRLDSAAREGQRSFEERLAELTPGSTITEALRDVEERDREPLLLHVWGDLSYEQVAHALEIPVGTVRSRIHRARGQLRDRLTEDDQDAQDDRSAPADLTVRERGGPGG